MLTRGLSSRHRTTDCTCLTSPALARARELLNAPAPEPVREPAADPLRDPHFHRPERPTCRACGERAVDHLPLPLVRGPPRRERLAA